MNSNNFKSRDNIKNIENGKKNYKDNYDKMEIDNDNFQKNNNESSKFRIYFSKLIKESRTSSDNKNEYPEIQFKCNICLNSSYIDISNKVTAISLLTYINFKENINYVYYLNNRIFKYMNQNKGIESFIFIRTFYRASDNLHSEKNYFYAFFFCKLAEQISEKSKIDQKSKKFLEELFDKIQRSISNYIQSKQNFFKNLVYDKERIFYIKNLIDCIGKENYESDKVYNIINGKWVNKAKLFFNEYERLTKNKYNNLLSFILKSFNRDNVYKNYIDEGINEHNLNLNEPFFPGPINNYEITLFKDFWEETSPHLFYENYYIKENLKINRDYYLINKHIWSSLNEIFESTNELLKKGNNEDLMLIKCIIFEKSLQENNNICHLRRKYIQISKNANILDFKFKLLRVVEKYQSKKENEDSNHYFNNIIKFYTLPYAQKDVLSEIIIAYSNKIKLIKSDINEIKIQDNVLMKDFPENGLRKNNLLLIEISNSQDILFLNEKNKICLECQNRIELEYKCNKCHLYEFCSEECFIRNIYHNEFHMYYDNYIIEEFSLKKLFSINLSNELSKNSNHGTSGLQNLGNTCYINSVIQCLSNTQDLTKYFLLNYYKQEINIGNKLGSYGVLADSYSNIIETLWKSKPNEIINPTNFINTIKNKIQYFSNNRQQDAHEFLSLFLDSLHEDINRISNKPYIVLKERLPNENDEIASMRWWNIHKSRENSIISDLFYGQFKSDIKCLDCNKSSITYDPFMFLELPVPISSTETTIKFFYRKDCYFFNYSVNKESRVIDLKNKCFELDVLVDYNNDDNKIFLIEGVVLDKNKIINKVINDDNEPILDYLTKGEEIIFFKKESLDCFLIYCYPISFVSENGFFSEKKKINFLSYPIALSVNHNTSLEDLNLIIQSEFSHMIKYNDSKKIFELLIYHNYEQKGFSFFSSKQKCEFCGQKFDLSFPFCKLDSVSDNETIGFIVNRFQNQRPFILLFSSDNYTTFIYYKNMPLSFDNYILEPLIRKKENPNIYDSLELYKKGEKLNDNEWYCTNCKSHKKAIKNSIIYKAPNYLIIHLKRFIVKKGKNDIESNKNNLFIDFPINDFDLSKSVIGPDRKKAIYNLYGIVEHFGNLLQGHYIAKCKNFDNWYEYNDSFVKKISKKEIITLNAYLLFYQKQVLDTEI